jgi:Na+/melibiose symporter-like transporter
MMNLSFQEKSLWLMFVSLVAAFVFYFVTVLRTDAVDVMPQQVVLFVLAVVILVITQIIGHIVIAVVDRRTQTDERDRLIRLKGTRNASYVLATGVFLALSAALLTEGNFVFSHLLLGCWVLAQLVEIGSQLFLYRRGV